jgi:hypothetical protein
MSAATVPAVSDISRSRLAVSASATRRKKISCARVRRADSAQDPAPSALPGSMGAIGRFSGPPDAPIGHPQREQPADLAAEGDGAPNAPVAGSDGAEGRWPARRRSGSFARRAADGGGASIEGARTCASGTSRGAVAVLRAPGPRPTQTGRRRMFGVAACFDGIAHRILEISKALLPLTN